MKTKYSIVENGIEDVEVDIKGLEHRQYRKLAMDLSYSFGYLLAYEVMALQIIALTLPEDAVIVNIGAGVGTSSLALREVSQKFKIYTVDISEGSPTGGLINERNAFKDAGIVDQLPEQLLGDSKEVGKEWKYGGIDLCIIDGDHSEDGCRGDIKAWMPHIKPNGIMAFHDYHRVTWPAVYRVVEEELKDWSLILWVQTYAFFKLL